MNIDRKQAVPVIGGLVLSLLIAFFLSPYASSFPDGLEKVAERLGFSEKGIIEIKQSSAFSGVLGTISVFFFVLGIGFILRKKKSLRGKNS